MERDKDAKGVPGEIRALLTPTKLDYAPKRARAFLRKKVLADGTQVGVLSEPESEPEHKPDPYSPGPNSYANWIPSPALALT